MSTKLFTLPPFFKKVLESEVSKGVSEEQLVSFMDDKQMLDSFSYAPHHLGYDVDFRWFLDGSYDVPYLRLCPENIEEDYED